MLNIVIPMAGRGSRFALAGYSEPKPLIKIGHRRMIELVINNLRPRRLHRFIFICQKEHLKAYNLKDILEELAPGCIVVAIDGITEGAASTVLCAKRFICNKDPLMIANSDQWVDVNIDSYLAAMDGQNLDGLIMTMKANDPKWSYVEFDNKKLVKRVVEKQVVSDEATVGIYNYRSGRDFCELAEAMITCNDRSNGEFYVAPVYTYMYERDRARIGVFNVGEEANGMYGLGTPEDLDLFKSLPVCQKALSF